MLTRLFIHSIMDANLVRFVKLPINGNYELDIQWQL